MTDEFTRHLTALARERHPQTSPVALQETAAYLSEQFINTGLDITTHQFMAWGQTYENVIGTKSAEHNADIPPLILAAHYDTVTGSPGADDNASALTVLLEVALVSKTGRAHIAGRPFNAPDSWLQIATNVFEQPIESEVQIGRAHV